MQSFPTYCTLYDYEGTETSFRKHMQTDETVQAKLRKHTLFCMQLVLVVACVLQYCFYFFSKCCGCVAKLIKMFSWFISDLFDFICFLRVTTKAKHSGYLVISEQPFSSILSLLLFVLFSVLTDYLGHLSWLEKWLRKWTDGLFCDCTDEAKELFNKQCKD